MIRPFNRRTVTAIALLAGAAMLQGCVYNPYTGTYVPCCAYSAAYGYPAYSGYSYPAYNGYGYPGYAYGGGVVVGGGWGGGYYRGGWGDGYRGGWEGHGGTR